MIIENSSDLIRTWQLVTLSDGSEVAEAELVNGAALVISPDTLALFRAPGDCNHPLRGGFLRSTTFDAEQAPEAPFIEEHRAGFVGLTGGGVLLIGLNEVRMYPGRDDALRNRNILCEMSLAPE